MELSKEFSQDEISRFRSSFKPESLDLAEKSLRLERQGNVGLLVFDAADSKANKLSTPMMLRLFELLSEVEKDKSYKALVVISRKPTIFIAGADISEIQGLSEGRDGAADALMKLQSVFTFLEHLPIPTVAAIHGACMGGGTELSLGCDYRIATDDKATKIALPEVLLGVLPGWGGTQRMPRLIGLEAALDLILTGKNLDATRAKKVGLVDKVCPAEYLQAKAVAWAEELGKRGKKRDYSTESKHTILERVPGAKWLILEQAKKQVLKKTHGNYPAPLKILEVIGKTYGGGIEKGLKVEAQAFAELVVTPESKALIHVYYLNEGVKKDAGVEGKVKPREVREAAVLGAGTMGGGIAQLFAAKGIRVRMKDINWDAITKGFAHAYKIFKKLVDLRRLKKFELDNSMERISGTTGYDGFQGLDLVVEAVVENMDVKKKVFAELDEKVKDGVLATNTSSLSVTEIAKATRNPGRVVGMHFFNPVDKMPLVEVIRGKDTSDESVATVFALSKKLGKTPIVVKDGPGFVVNRILAPYLNETAFLLAEGVTPRHLDKVAVAFGMPMGPAELLDEVGLDVATKVSKILYGAFGDRMKPPSLLEKVVEEGRLGKKSGKGIYVHRNDKEKEEDLTWLRSVGAKVGEAKVSDEDIVKRLVYVMINEAARVLDEELVRSVSDIDVGMIFGTGFAPFRGGLLRYADSIGADSVVSDLEILSRHHGDRFKPSDYLQKLAVAKKKFYE